MLFVEQSVTYVLLDRVDVYIETRVWFLEKNVIFEKIVGKGLWILIEEGFSCYCVNL